MGLIFIIYVDQNKELYLPALGRLNATRGISLIRNPHYIVTLSYHGEPWNKARGEWGLVKASKIHD